MEDIQLVLNNSNNNGQNLGLVEKKLDATNVNGVNSHAENVDLVKLNCRKRGSVAVNYM